MKIKKKIETGKRNQNHKEIFKIRIQREKSKIL